ncbi:MAG TPA: zinc-dependent metalloprotease family protein [Thermoanaerobaculia bacterium]|nr:zinc-dependent metalloprotease family protein [Thermoanaerobaculia bacterium]
MSHRIPHPKLAVVVVLAVAALAPSPAEAAQPAAATVAAGQDAEWSGSFLVPNPLPIACTIAGDPTCDHFALTVDAPAGTHVAVAITAANPTSNDLDLLVYAPNGSLVRTAATSTGTEALVFAVDPAAHGTGAYQVRVQPWLVTPGTTYQGAAGLTEASVEGGIGTFPLDDCSDLLGPDTLSLDFGDQVALDVMVLLDGVAPERAQEVFASAATSYLPINVRLTWQLRPVEFATDDANQLISLAKQEVGGVRPAGVDIVYVMTTKDIQVGGDTAVAGLADCISGVGLADRAFAVGEDFGAAQDAGIALGPFTHTVAGSAVVVAHEIGHLMGAHHHYGNCVEGVTAADAQSLELTPCTLMFNAVNFASLPFGTLNRAVVRGHASDFARP